MLVSWRANQEIGGPGVWVKGRKTMVGEVSRSRLIALHNHLCASTPLHPQGVTYGLGDKAVPLDIDSSMIASLDCSGYVCYTCFYAAGHMLRLPDGSANQHQWCLDQGLSRVSYEQAGTVPNETLKICFLTPEKQPDGIGHVWWLIWDDSLKKGQTYECHGGCGVDTRDWNAPIEGGSLADCDACFVFPSVA